MQQSAIEFLVEVVWTWVRNPPAPLGLIAQLVEQWTLNPRVVGSSPTQVMADVVISTFQLVNSFCLRSTISKQ